MSDIRLSMTDEEAEEFSNLSEEQKDKFFESVKLRKQELMLKTAVASMFLVECFDELEQLGVLRNKLKQTGKAFNKHIEKFVEDIFNNNEENSDSTEYINEMIKRFHKNFEYESILPIIIHPGVENINVNIEDGKVHVRLNK